MKNINSISVIGLGKLGLCSAACFASKGYKVIGVDIDSHRVDLINKGNSPIQETNLAETLKKCKNNLKATTDYKEAIDNSQVTFIVVATPSEADGSFSNQQLEESLKAIGTVLKDKNDYHLIVVTSTVMPGTCEHVGKFILEETSGKKCGKDFGIAYNPEFIALGSVIHDFLNPDFLLIGEINNKDGDVLEEIYKNTCDNEPKFGRMNLVSAEIAKISLNCYITMKITYANSLAAICEKVPQANAAVITAAIGMDERIGVKYIKPGLGFGGPCFPRDNVAFTSFANKVGVKAKLAEMVDEVNRDQVRRIENIVKDIVSGLDKKKNSINIGVLGLSYKPNTPIIEDSQAIDIVELLTNEGYKLEVYDPMSLDLARGVLGDTVRYGQSSQKCAEESDILLITTPWEEFKNIDLSACRKDLVILDCWEIFKDKETGKNIKYLGKG
ncbi:UDP-glucose/GDP-mannose dehydrogenase family protein [Patescibacteria group bacterium]|nr:UDP-glucose/GDP-mannose dehydrogenase family protein [Patescibacteria group bacterium]